MESLSPAGRNPGTLLRFSADRRTLAILFTNSALVAAAWVLAPDGAWLPITLAVLGYTGWLCAVAAHNTVHTPVSTSAG